jgi:hypothetical protein
MELVDESAVELQRRFPPCEDNEPTFVVVVTWPVSSDRLGQGFDRSKCPAASSVDAYEVGVTEATYRGLAVPLEP